MHLQAIAQAASTAVSSGGASASSVANAVAIAVSASLLDELVPGCKCCENIPLRPVLVARQALIPPLGAQPCVKCLPGLSAGPSVQQLMDCLDRHILICCVVLLTLHVPARVGMQMQHQGCRRRCRMAMCRAPRLQSARPAQSPTAAVRPPLIVACHSVPALLVVQSTLQEGTVQAARRLRGGGTDCLYAWIIEQLSEYFSAFTV